MIYRSSRRNQLLELIITKQIISVNELLEKFNVSPATIRKDLSFLEESGLITRTRGEVHAIQSLPYPTIDLRKGHHFEEKEAIAREAIKFINDGDTIILDSGSTTAEIAKLLGDFSGLTIVTHSLEICYILRPFNITAILAGGIFNRDTMTVIGPQTEHFFSGIEANKMFLSASGVRNNNGLTVSSPYEYAVKKMAVNAAKEIYAVLDSSKFSNACINQIAEFKDIDVLITDDKLDNEDAINSLKENNVKLILVDAKI